MPALPIWVPAVLLLLLVLGYRQSRTRQVRPGLIIGLALAMFGFSLYGVESAFGISAPALAAWAAGYAGSALLGGRWWVPAGLASDGRTVRMPGSWVPMALMMGIFAAKFVLGFAAGTGSPVMHEPGFAAAMSLALGTLSGGFGARALAVFRLASANGPDVRRSIQHA